ncbi:unnamed protein product [Caenorhabditis sp. 36 PRJEB53466]|nr:unnamed protein product [Caenorhabditis sp. 36 PRJEB53466]
MGSDGNTSTRTSGFLDLARSFRPIGWSGPKICWFEINKVALQPFRLSIYTKFGPDVLRSKSKKSAKFGNDRISANESKFQTSGKLSQMATEVDTTKGILVLIAILLGIAIPIIAFWVLIIWCSRRKRKRMAEFNATPAASTPVAEDVEAAAPAPAPAAPEAPDGPKEEAAAAKSSKSAAKSAKSDKSGKSKDEEEGGKTGDGAKTGDGKTGDFISHFLQVSKDLQVMSSSIVVSNTSSTASILQTTVTFLQSTILPNVSTSSPPPLTSSTVAPAPAPFPEPYMYPEFERSTKSSIDIESHVSAFVTALYIVVGIFVFVCIVPSLIFCCCCCYRRYQANQRFDEFMNSPRTEERGDRAPSGSIS